MAHHHQAANIDLGGQVPTGPVFGLLGPLRTPFHPDVQITGRQRIVLALLALNANSAVPYRQLMEALWKEPPASARQQIHNVISSLRQLLATTTPAAALATDGAGYQLMVDRTRVDVFQFHEHIARAQRALAQQRTSDAVAHLTAALALWRGSALADIDSQAIRAIAAGLNEERLSAIELLTTLRINTGEAASVIGELLEVVTANPLRETLRANLMIALYETGRQAEALAVYDQARQLLQHEFGLDPGPALRQLHMLILRGDAVPVAGALEPHRPIDTAQAEVRRPSVPSFIPHETREFTGRSAELSKLCDEIKSTQQSALAITSIVGMGGVGKTTLAVRLARQIASDYPDGQYFIDLCGFSGIREPLKPIQALANLLYEAGVQPDAIPSNLEMCSNLWKTTLANKRVLILLDNAHDFAQIQPLLPASAQSLIIITSRRRLVELDGAVPLALDIMPIEEARELFIRVAGRSAGNDEVDTIIELCGHLPLAIRIAAARFRARPSWTLADLADRLGNQSLRSRFLSVGDRDITDVLEVSYRFLRPEAQRFFRLLSLHPGHDFDAYAAAAICEATVIEAEYCLDLLYEDNLLTQRQAGRFQFHDLVRDCAQAIVGRVESPASQASAMSRLLDYYVAAANTWCKSVALGPFRFEPRLVGPFPTLHESSSGDDPFELVVREHANFMAIAQSAMDSGSLTHAWQLPCSLLPYFARSNFSGASAQLFTNALVAAQAGRDAYGEMTASTAVAIICRQNGALDESRRLFSEALQSSRSEGWATCEMYLLIELGIIEISEDHLRRGLERFSAAYEMATFLSDGTASAALASNLGLLSMDLGRLDNATTYFAEALRLGKQHSSKGSLALTSINVARLNHTKGDLLGARDGFVTALADCRAVGSLMGEAAALLGVSAVSRTLGHQVEAVARARDALRVASSADLHELESEALNTLGEALLTRSDLDEAETTFFQSLELATQWRLPRCSARAHEGLAHAQLRRGNGDTARDHWTQALGLYPHESIERSHATIHLSSQQATTCGRCRMVAQREPSV